MLGQQFTTVVSLYRPFNVTCAGRTHSAGMILGQQHKMEFLCPGRTQEIQPLHF
jgi:hypothetical protein